MYTYIPDKDDGPNLASDGYEVASIELTILLTTSRVYDIPIDSAGLDGCDDRAEIKVRGA